MHSNKSLDINNWQQVKSYIKLNNEYNPSDIIFNFYIMKLEYVSLLFLLKVFPIPIQITLIVLKRNYYNTIHSKTLSLSTKITIT